MAYKDNWAGQVMGEGAMHVWIIFTALLLLSIVSAYACRKFILKVSDFGIYGSQAKWHLLVFASGTLVVTFLVAVLLLGSRWLYDALQGANFTMNQAGDSGLFNAESYVGLLAVLFGVPLAISGALYAIYLAQVSLAISRAQFELTKRQLIQDHPFYEAFIRIWALKWILGQQCSKLRKLIEQDSIDRREIMEGFFPSLRDTLVELKGVPVMRGLVAFEVTASELQYEGAIFAVSAYEDSVVQAVSRLDGILERAPGQFKSDISTLLNLSEKVHGLIPGREALLRTIDFPSEH
ncbi:hypothetical protein WCE37_00995 [Luteimonas sp. MJ250]|uniref:hypothetical protein n=1 Tax=Luteimonas sp. MJ250 TaxID=3129236 RepID=UPI0031BB3102